MNALPVLANGLHVNCVVVLCQNKFNFSLKMTAYILFVCLFAEKCYVDMRKEKCFSKIRSANGVEGIYTGYSANGSYCFVPVLNAVSSDFASLVGHVFKHGFPIPKNLNESPCREKWDIVVKKKRSSSSKF